MHAQPAENPIALHANRTVHELRCGNSGGAYSSVAIGSSAVVSPIRPLRYGPVACTIAAFPSAVPARASRSTLCLLHHHADEAADRAACRRGSPSRPAVRGDHRVDRGVDRAGVASTGSGRVRRDGFGDRPRHRPCRGGEQLLCGHLCSRPACPPEPARDVRARTAGVDAELVATRLLLRRWRFCAALTISVAARFGSAPPFTIVVEEVAVRLSDASEGGLLRHCNPSTCSVPLAAGRAAARRSAPSVRSATRRSPRPARGRGRGSSGSRRPLPCRAGRRSARSASSQP